MVTRYKTIAWFICTVFHVLWTFCLLSPTTQRMENDRLYGYIDGTARPYSLLNFSWCHWSLIWIALCSSTHKCQLQLKMQWSPMRFVDSTSIVGLDDWLANVLQLLCVEFAAVVLLLPLLLPSFPFPVVVF